MYESNFTYWTVVEYSAKNYITGKEIGKIKPIWNNNFEKKEVKNVPTYFKFNLDKKLIIYNEEFHIISSKSRWKKNSDKDGISIEILRFNTKSCYIDIDSSNEIYLKSKKTMDIKFYPKQTDGMVHSFKLVRIFPNSDI